MANLPSFRNASRSSDLDTLIGTTPSQLVFARIRDDAQSIIMSRDTESYVGTAMADTGADLETTFDMDEEISKSGPYVRNYRNLMRQQFAASTSTAPHEPKVTPAPQQVES